VGQGDDVEAVVSKAYKTGASKVVVEALREEFLTGYVWPALKAGAVYENKYLLGTALARPVIAKHQVEVALREALRPSAMAVPARGTTRCASRWRISAGSGAEGSGSVARMGFEVARRLS